ncbi:winged helix-turn-helix domain-containing protein (plasmid) [Rhodobacter capsulatus]
MEKPRESNIERLRTALLEMIRELNLSLGDRLPTEKEMAERFQVSRPTLREALKLLEQEAVIDVHQGKGRFLAAGGQPEHRAADHQVRKRLADGGQSRLQGADPGSGFCHRARPARDRRQA